MKDAATVEAAEKKDVIDVATVATRYVSNATAAEKLMVSINICGNLIRDLRERELSAEDIVHYGRVVSALGETIRIMREVDEAIESAGGWAVR